MPLPSIQKLLNKIQANLKYELGELSKLVEAHPEHFNQYLTTDKMNIETAGLLNHKIQRTSERLLEQIDLIANTKPAKKELPVSNDLGAGHADPPKVKPVRRRGRKTKIGSRP